MQHTIETGLRNWRRTEVLGGLAAGFIKAAISRQKEYLADASAVQFTRNSQGIADALDAVEPTRTVGR